MHKDILTDTQIALFPLLKEFSSDFGLVGGTAIALQIGHRHSIDYDLFTNKPFDHLEVRAVLSKNHSINQTIIDSKQELTLIVDEVKMTFYTYPYTLHFSEKFEDIISLPSLRTLAAMKAFALGRRAKWKDYVDLYFLSNKLGFSSIIQESQQLFGSEFDEKLFRSQICYFEDIDYSEEVFYVANHSVNQEKIKTYLVNQAIHN